MDWFKIIVVIVIVLQEINLISLRKELHALTNMVVLTIANKGKTMSIKIMESDENKEGETSSDE